MLWELWHLSFQTHPDTVTTKAILPSLFPQSEQLQVFPTNREDIHMVVHFHSGLAPQLPFKMTRKIYTAGILKFNWNFESLDITTFYDKQEVYI